MYSDLMKFIDRFDLGVDCSQDSSLFRSELSKVEESGFLVHPSRVKESGETCLILYLNGSKPEQLQLVKLLEKFGLIDIDETYKYKHESFFVMKADFDYELFKRNPFHTRQMVFETFVRMGLKEPNGIDKFSQSIEFSKIEPSEIKAEIDKRKFLNRTSSASL